MIERSIDVGGLVHYLDFGGEGPHTFVLVHGLGGSAINWVRTAPLLAAHGRVLALDLAGFGRSPTSPGRSTVKANRDLLGRFIQAMSPGRPVVLVGNSMGGMVATLLAALRPSLVSGLVLACPALLAPFWGELDTRVMQLFLMTAPPGLGEWLLQRQRAKAGPDALVDQMMKLCCVEPQSIPEPVLEQHRVMSRARAQMSWAEGAYLEAQRSLMWQMSLGQGETIGAMRAVQAPVLLIQGVHDRLVPRVSSERASRLCPSWRLEMYESSGHTPMLEEPGRFADSITLWLARHQKVRASA
jgi:pimeloyl-ACP methyl ester carboxylesterase